MQLLSFINADYLWDKKVYFRYNNLFVQLWSFSWFWFCSNRRIEFVVGFRNANGFRLFNSEALPSPVGNISLINYCFHFSIKQRLLFGFNKLSSEKNKQMLYSRPNIYIIELTEQIGESILALCGVMPRKFGNFFVPLEVFSYNILQKLTKLDRKT